MHASLEEILQKEKIMVIDGSMSTALEALGANLNNTLWTASVLRDQPELVRQVHYDYLKAGADCGITCSYQATIPGLLKAGCSKEEMESAVRFSFCGQNTEEEIRYTLDVLKEVVPTLRRFRRR